SIRSGLELGDGCLLTRAFARKASWRCRSAGGTHSSLLNAKGLGEIALGARLHVSAPPRPASDCSGNHQDSHGSDHLFPLAILESAACLNSPALELVFLEVMTFGSLHVVILSLLSSFHPGGRYPGVSEPLQRC